MPRLSLEIGLETTTTLELELVNVTFDEIADVIDELGVSSLNLDLRKINNYLEDSYQIISDYSADSNEKRSHYVTSLAIYYFGKSLLELEISETRRKGFINLARREYGIKQPLNLYFKMDSDAKFLDESEERKAKNETEIVARVFERKSFSTERTKKNVLRELWILSNLLKSRNWEYNQIEHLVFSGLYNVALPLTGGYRERNIHVQLYERLKEKFGEFVFKIPKSLE